MAGGTALLPGIGSNTPLGKSGNTASVTGTGAALDLNGFNLVTAEPLSLVGTGVNFAGALTNSGSAATYLGVVTLGTGGATIGGSGDITLSAPFAANSNDLTKAGTATLTLSEASTRTGNTTVEAGTTARWTGHSKRDFSGLESLCYAVGGGVPTPRVWRYTAHASRGEGTAPTGRALG